MAAIHQIRGFRRLILAGLGGALIGFLTGAAALDPVAVAEHWNAASAIWWGGGLGAIGGALTGLIAGDS